jgi:DNA repair exonuclease SbcCD nuclease subunit
MRFLHTADWHLGRYFHGATLLDDQAHILDQLVALAVPKNQIQSAIKRNFEYFMNGIY